MFHYNCPNTAATLTEEGIRRITPSSFEISFPAELASTYANTTLGNIERHAKTRKTAPEPSYRTSNRA